MASHIESGIKRARTWEAGGEATSSRKKTHTKLPKRWHEEIKDERRLNLTLRVEELRREVGRKVEQLEPVRGQTVDYSRRITRVDQRYAEVVTPPIEELVEPSQFIDSRIEHVFRGLEIPLRELELFGNEKAFQLECNAEKMRIALQEKITHNQSKLCTFSKTFEEVMETEEFTTIDEVKWDGSAFASLDSTRHMSNEDRHLEYTFFFKNQPATVRAVFDGHGGSFASQYCRDHFEKALRKCWKQFVTLGNDFEIANALITAFVRLDAAHRLEVLKEHHARPTPGTTACVSLMVGEKLFIANAGDSRAVLCTSNSTDAQQLSYDYKGSDVYAQMTVTARGGQIINGRVAYKGKASLAVTRAIGDEYLRRKDGSKPISPRPGIIMVDLSKLEKRDRCTLLLMSDGASDVATPEAMSRQVSRMRARGDSSGSIAASLVAGAKVAGSCDDITVGVVFL